MTKGLSKVIAALQAEQYPQEYIEFIIQKNCRIKDAKGISSILKVTKKAGNIASLDNISRLYDLLGHTSYDLAHVYHAFGFDFDKIERYVALSNKYIHVVHILETELYRKSLELQAEIESILTKKEQCSQWCEEHNMETETDEYRKNHEQEYELTIRARDISRMKEELQLTQDFLKYYFYDFLKEVVNHNIESDIVDYIMKKEEHLRLCQFPYYGRFNRIDTDHINLFCANLQYIYFINYKQANARKGLDLLYNDLKLHKMQSLLIYLLDNNLLLFEKDNMSETIVKFFIEHPEKRLKHDTVISISDDDYLNIIFGNNKFFDVSKEFMNNHNHTQRWVNNQLKALVYQEHESVKKIKDFNQSIDLKCDTSIDLPYYDFELCIHRNGYINITIRNFPTTLISYEEYDDHDYYNDYNISGDYSKYTSYKITITPDGGLYDGHNNLKPLSLKRVYAYMKNPLFKEYMDIFTQHKVLLLWNDILVDCQEIDNCFIPLAFNDLYNHGNKANLLKDTYQDAKNLKINFNKININLAYMIIKTKKYITEDSIGTLQNIRNTSIIKDQFVSYVSGKKIKHAVSKFICNYFREKGYKSYHEINDYVSCCIEDRRKINLNHSEARLLDDHNHYLVNADFWEVYHKTENIKIPAHSKFNLIYKHMPKEFERIKTRKRIATEAASQNNCVWTYARSINQDRCCILSLYDKDAIYDDSVKRYTIEIRRKNNKFVAEQIKSQHNQEGSKKIHQYINQTLNQINKEYC